MSENVQYPLRERRKRRTREALMSAAAELFYTQGYDETRMDEIAERAEVHVQTLYKHFSTKEDLAMEPYRLAYEQFREGIEDPERDQDTLTFWRNWVAESAARALEPNGNNSKKFLNRTQTRENVPSLAMASLRLWHQYEDLLTEALAQDMGLDAEADRLPRLLACMLWGGNHHAVRRWAASNGKLDLAHEAAAVVDDVIAMTGNGQRKKRK